MIICTEVHTSALLLEQAVSVVHSLPQWLHHEPQLTAVFVAMQDVSARYGHPVVVLNLVKSAEKRPRETILRKEFAIAIAYINQQV